MPTSMTAAAPAATVLPQLTLQPNVAPRVDKSLNEKTVTEKAVDRILSDKPVRKTGRPKSRGRQGSPREKPAAEKTRREDPTAAP
jgi:hypothetical protein